LDLDCSVLARVLMWLSSTEAFRCESVCRFHATFRNIPFHLLHETVAKGAMSGSLDQGQIWLHALLHRDEIVHAVQSLRRCQIQAALKFHSPGEARCILHALQTDDFLISWDVQPGRFWDWQVCSGKASSLPVSFRHPSVKFDARLAVHLSASSKLTFEWDVIFGSLLMEQQDYVSISLGGNIPTPFGVVALPESVFCGASCVEPGTREASPSESLEWIEARLRKGLPITSVTHIRLWVSGEEQFGITFARPQRARAMTT